MGSQINLIVKTWYLMLLGCILGLGSLLIKGRSRPVSMYLASLSIPTLAGTVLCLEPPAEPLQSVSQALALGSRERALETRLCDLWPGPLLLAPTDGTALGIHPQAPSYTVHSVVVCFPLGPVLVRSVVPVSISAPIKIPCLSYVSLNSSDNFTHPSRPTTNMSWWDSVWPFQANVLISFLCPESLVYTSTAYGMIYGEFLEGRKCLPPHRILVSTRD